MISDLLAKLLGRHRALAAGIWLHEFGALIAAAVLFCAIVISTFIFFELEPHQHDAYVEGQVQGIVPLGGKSGGYLVDVILPDSTALRLMTKRGAVFGGIIDTACVERRKLTVSGGYRHRLVIAQLCDSG